MINEIKILKTIHNLSDSEIINELKIDANEYQMLLENMNREE